MSRSAGAGSPISFVCPRERTAPRGGPAHTQEVTGRVRRYHQKAGTSLGLRSMSAAVEFTCSCGHQGWSNHVDLVVRAWDEEGKARGRLRVLLSLHEKKRMEDR